MKTETFNALLSRLKRDTSDTDLSYCTFVCTFKISFVDLLKK